MSKRVSVLVAAVFVAAAVPAVAAAAPELALKRVMLSTGGVAYYEYEAAVEGDAVLELAVRLDQVDDVLKSVVVYDDKGAVGTIRLPGREPLKEVFRDLPFDAAAFASSADLLTALQGVEIEVAGTRAVRGRIISVVPEAVLGKDGSDEVTLRHRVSLMTATGVEQFVLEDAVSVRFVDAKLSEQIEKALSATARHRVMDRRVLEIDARGEGKRAVRVAYVVAAPIWKTTYRLTVSENGISGYLQGWAVLENQSGHDWKNVDLTLVSGNPVTFRQALYESYYIDRPEVPVEVMGRVLPRIDSGGIPVPAPAAPAREMLKSMMPDVAPYAERAELAPRGRAMGPALALAPARTAERADTTEAATQVLFHMPRPVSVADGNSLVVPIVDRDIPATRLALFQRTTNSQHPLVAVRLVNDGESSLPPGVFTVYEKAGKAGAVSFVGDARIGALPKGEERFASFALDSKIRVDEEKSAEKVFQRATVSQGVLRMFSLSRDVSTYSLAGPKTDAPAVVIEHPRREGWTLVSPDPKSVTATPGAYRVTAKLGTDGAATVKVIQERVGEERLSLVDLDGDRFTALSRQSGMPEAAVKAFIEAARLKSRLEGLNRQIDDLGKERDAVVTDQDRVRENLGAAPAGSDLQRRYQKKLTEQEDRLEAIDKQVADLAKQARQARDELAKYLAGLTF